MISTEKRAVERLLDRSGPNLGSESDPRRDAYDEILLALGKCWTNEGPSDSVGDEINKLDRSQDPKEIGDWSPFFIKAVSAIDRQRQLNSVPLDELVSNLTRELGGDTSYTGGLAVYVRTYCARVMDKQVHPYIAAQCLRWAGLHADADPSGAITAAIDLAQQWDNDPARRSDIERDIATLAHRVLENV